MIVRMIGKIRLVYGNGRLGISDYDALTRIMGKHKLPVKFCGPKSKGLLF
jgi:hypothetical protein